MSWKSQASRFRKHIHGRKPDFWVPMKIIDIMHEFVFEETTGGPFVVDDKKYMNDLRKLFRFGHDSKIMLGSKIIFKNIKYLGNEHEKLWKKLRDAGIFLFQAYSALYMLIYFS